MPCFGKPRATEITAEAFQTLFDESRTLRGESSRLHERVTELEAQLRGDGRRPPAQSWVKPPVPKGPGSPPKKPRGKKGHEAHHRPPPSADKDTVELSLRLRACPYGAPFDWSDRWVDRIIPGHVEHRHYRVAH